PREEREGVLRFEEWKLMRDERLHINHTRSNQLDCYRKVMLNVRTDTANQVSLLIEELVNPDLKVVTIRQSEQDHGAVAANEIGREIQCLFFTDGFNYEIRTEAIREVEHSCFQLGVLTKHVRRAHTRRYSQTLRKTIHCYHALGAHVSEQRAEQLAYRSLTEHHSSFAEQVRQLSARMD